MNKRVLSYSVIALSILSGLLGLHCCMLDGLDGWVLSLGDPSNTVYANSYSDVAFRAVKVGMRTNEVAAVLGPPLAVYGERDPNGKPWKYRQQIGELWQYSKQVEDLSFHVRNIVIQDGRVREIVCEYYVD